jgi:uncharacterized RDD family membrane protein YckC
LWRARGAGTDARASKLVGMNDTPPPAPGFQQPPMMPGQATPPGGAPAGLGKRILGGIVDTVLLGIVYFVLVKTMGDSNTSGSNVSFSLNGLPAVLFFVISIGYYVVLEGTGGKTVGKMLASTRVVRYDGAGAISWGQALGRNLLRVIDGFCCGLIGLIIIAVNKDNQRLGDMAAKTLVIND